MKTTLTPERSAASREALRRANTAFSRVYPGESSQRQPVHTVYGGAHLFRATTARKMGDIALAAMRDHAPDGAALAHGLGLSQQGGFAQRVYARVVDKLEREPVEDFRLDFEDGYGHRPDAEEDAHAVSAAQEVARGLAQGTLPPFIGIRVKALTEELYARSSRTLDLFVTSLLEHTGGRLPPSFVVTLPKVTVPEQVTALAHLLSELESVHGLPSGALMLELMVETPQALFDSRGRPHLLSLVEAGEGRCSHVHLGAYDYTSALNVSAHVQGMLHPACDFLRDTVQVLLAGTGVRLSDGATTLMPVGPHRKQGDTPLLPAQLRENTDAVHRAWQVAWRNTRHSLERAYYQGWDLHPAQLPVRYAAVYAFFLEGLEPSSQRLKAFVDKAAQATMLGGVFDDAATGQGLLNFFLRGLACGALTEEEVRATGLTLEELRGRSFRAIVQARAAPSR
ncbi:phosphoenolpyruvate kinase [Corallococcus sp. ZKHCc1 1396]|uniref:Phosphoenolpyruvate kinase n=1 Tax=Corallococcus soli TaxID=2710757 RepID=A0ABR9PQ99_9BACT|nr:phosphoenolpyruvate kinase [Corallococcus soli]MBE4750094.1 phosphoenolpyruvate kinase [Corallococcus soli]